MCSYNFPRAINLSSVINTNITIKEVLQKLIKTNRRHSQNKQLFCCRNKLNVPIRHFFRQKRLGKYESTRWMNSKTSYTRFVINYYHKKYKRYDLLTIWCALKSWHMSIKSQEKHQIFDFAWLSMFWYEAFPIFVYYV